jgi:3-oxoacyl-[acyl-carrier protein] reductase
MLDFTGKVVLVTGAGTGIGAAVAKGFGARGAHVVVHYRSSREAAEKVVATIAEEGGSASSVGADLTEPGAAKALVDGVVAEHGRLDVLVNNAGDLVRRSPVVEMSDELYEQIMNLNMTSVFAMCRAAVPVLTRPGSIVNVTSIAARHGGAGGSAVYATSKAAVSTFTRGLAKEVAHDGIRVNAISPGVITTPFHERHTKPEMMEAMVRTIPMGRTGTPDECVGATLFLASEEMSGYVTGQIVEINGGQLTP